MVVDNFVRGISAGSLQMIGDTMFSEAKNVRLAEICPDYEGLGDVVVYDVQHRDGKRYNYYYGEFGPVLPKSFNPNTMSFDSAKYLLPLGDRDFLWYMGLATCNFGKTNNRGEAFFDAVEKRIMASIENGKNIPTSVRDVSSYEKQTQDNFKVFRKAYLDFFKKCEDIGLHFETDENKNIFED